MQNSAPIKRQLFLFIILNMHINPYIWNEFDIEDNLNIFEVDEHRERMTNIPSYFRSYDSIDNLNNGFKIFKADIKALEKAGAKIITKISSEANDYTLPDDIYNSDNKKIRQRASSMSKTNISCKNISRNIDKSNRLSRLTAVLYDMMTFETNNSCHFQLLFTKEDYISKYCEPEKSAAALEKQFQRDIKVLSEIGIIVKKFENKKYLTALSRDDDYWKYFSDFDEENLEFLNRRQQAVFDRNAFMVRNDGEIFPCIQHIYANLENIYETLYAAEWLYENTADDNTRKIICSLVKTYGEDLDKVNILKAIYKDIAEKPFHFLSKSFLGHLESTILSYRRGNLSELMAKVNNLLNQEFLRARYGGMYASKKDSKDMYFRISSENFDWLTIIKQITQKIGRRVDTVTVACDEESTGLINTFYYTKNGQAIDKIPLKDFLNLEEICYGNNNS